MKTTIESTADGRIIHTTNGVDVRSAAVYVKELKEFTPQPNGWNAELADHIYGIITAHPALWNQGAWREVFVITDDPTANIGLHVRRKKSLKDLFGSLRDFQTTVTDFTPEPEPATCGTAMCVAGWVGEVTGVHWVSDLSLIKKSVSSQHSDRVIVTKEFADNYPAIMASWSLGMFNIPTYKNLLERGFSTEKHVTVSVSSYALVQLGLIHGDWLDLFAANNNQHKIRQIMDTYAEHGITPDPEVWQTIYGYHPGWDAETYEPDVY